MADDASAAGSAAAPQPASAEVWTENPMQGKFNPGTKSGEAIFKLKTKGLPEGKRISLDPQYAQQFRRLLQAKSATFGAIVTKVPVEFDAAGNPTKYKNLTTEYSSIELERLQRNALKRFGTAIAETDPIPSAPFTKRDLDPANDADDKKLFYERVDANVVTEWIPQVLDDVSYSTLLLSMDEFTFVDTNGSQTFEGTIMLKKVLDELDPCVVVGVENLRKKLEEIRLDKYNENVKDMITDIEHTYKQILALGKDCESIRRYVITALASAKNKRFKDYVHRMNDDVESGTGQYCNFDWKQICASAKTKYVNMSSTGEWNEVNPHEAKLLALATKVDQLEKQNAALATTNASNSAPPQNNVRSNVDRTLAGGVERWRTVKKGPSIQVDGKTFFWCPHHKHPKGFFDGLYCIHRPENHAEWKAKYKKNRPTDTNADDKDAPADDGKKKLSINQRLREVLCSKLMLSDEDADNICKHVTQEN